MTLKHKLLWHILPICTLIILYQLLLTAAYMKAAAIPFSVSIDDAGRRGGEKKLSSLSGIAHADGAGIYAVRKLEGRRDFFHLFNVPYIVCFFAAKGKWPFIPSFMQLRVDMASKSFFSQNDSLIRQVCQKWIQIKECFRPIFAPATPLAEVVLDKIRSTPCTCANLVSPEPVVYFDKNYIGNVSSDIILNTIEFLQNFLPPPTKKPKRKNTVRSRVDEIDID